MDLESEIAAYATAAREHGEATTAGDAPAANRAYDRLERSWKCIQSSVDDWRALFFNLLEHNEPWVRLWAASHVIHSDPHRSLAVLRKLSREPGLLGFGAQMTIETWEKGQLGEGT